MRCVVCCANVLAVLRCHALAMPGHPATTNIAEPEGSQADSQA